MNQFKFRYRLTTHLFSIDPIPVTEKDVDTFDFPRHCIESRIKAIQNRIAYGLIPYFRINSLSTIQEFVSGGSLTFPPLVSSAWCQYIKSRYCSRNASLLSRFYLALSPLFLRFYLFAGHLRKAFLLRLIIANTLLRKQTIKPNHNDILFEEASPSALSSYLNPHLGSWDLYHSLLSGGLITHDQKVFHRSLQSHYQKSFLIYPLQPVRFDQFIRFFLGALILESKYLASIFTRPISALHFLIDEFHEVNYLRKSSHCSYENLYRTVSSHFGSSRLSNYPDRSGRIYMPQTVIFYSTNDRPVEEKLKQYGAVTYTQFPYHSIVTISLAHALYIRSISSFQSIFSYKILPSLSYTDDPSKNIKCFPRSESSLSILLLLVEPKASSHFRSLGFPQEQRSDLSEYIQTLQDVAEISNQYSINVYIKPKRRTDCNQHIATHIPQAHIIEPSISYVRAINQVRPDLIICSPFTSAALYKKSTSIYYVPTKTKMLTYNESYEETPVIKGRAALASYVSTLRDTLSN